MYVYSLRWKGGRLEDRIYAKKKDAEAARLEILAMGRIDPDSDDGKKILHVSRREVL